VRMRRNAYERIRQLSRLPRRSKECMPVTGVDLQPGQTFVSRSSLPS
jgi:hypothetical protein